MAKDVKNAETSKSVNDNSLAGRVTGLRATAADFHFDIEDKKGRTHTLRLEPAAASLASIVAGAYASGKKLHVTAGNGAMPATATELRFGNKPKVSKPKVTKPPKAVSVTKTAAEYAAAPAKQAEG